MHISQANFVSIYCIHSDHAAHLHHISMRSFAGAKVVELKWASIPAELPLKNPRKPFRAHVRPIDSITVPCKKKKEKLHC